MNMTGLSLGQVALAALMDIAYAFAIGSALLERWLALEGQPARAALERARASLVAACFALVLADGLWLVYQSAEMSGLPLLPALGKIPVVLGATQIGHAWCVAFGGALLALAAALTGRGGRLGEAVFVFAALVVALGKACLGHAADDGPWSAAVAVQALHLAATGVWGGIALAGGLTVLPALESSTTRGVLIRVAGRLSHLAGWALAVVIATGLFNAQRGLGGALAPLSESGWGHVLTLKGALVMLAVLLGALNRTSALPRLRKTASTVDAHTFRNVLHLEALVMIGVFIVAAVLAHMAPGYTSLH
ncbi:copper resistance protein CopD [Trinickia dabaoshanensis]|uniref:Copper resistance protein CopD n=1 Tax=Trinickia dabaoshanensis TaxID=564714 RepID=A0A2N7VVY7_9BURK|nr:CopD family protein [Trinickia dabaoshanensis]PMS21316.1 copper resistance protein CopD [Trinickia dabaoshanensis]